MQTLKISEIINLYAAIRSLDGRDKIVKDGGIEKVVAVPYKLTGNTRMSLARALGKLKPHVLEFETTVAELRKAIEAENQRNGDEDAKLHSLRVGRLIADSTRPLLSEDVDVDLKKITAADLDLERNEIPPSTLEMMSPLIEDDNE